MAILKRVSRKTRKPAYQVLIDQRDPVTGERWRVTVGTFPTKREAREEETKALRERDRGTLLVPDRTTVAELLDKYSSSKCRVPYGRRISPRTRSLFASTSSRHLATCSFAS